MADSAEGGGRDERRLGAMRLIVGLVQGLLLYGLSRAEHLKAWPATDAPLFADLSLACAFAPLVLLAGVGHLRWRTLVIWTLVAAALSGVMAWYAASSALPSTRVFDPYFFPTSVGLFAAVALFCAHHLIAPADAERRLLATYPAYFDAAWLDGVRFAMACAFTGVFWILLALGAGLFDLIGLKGFGIFISHDWFYFPATGLVFATAVHIADVRVGLTRGLRTIVLVLLSWLLPVMGIITIAFLMALPFTGLTLLWRAGAATGVLLGSIGALVVLINAAYQAGSLDKPPPAILRWSVRATALALVPLAGVAVYGLALRIGQHGLTESRIAAAACAAVAVCYALGYAWAAVRHGRWMRRLEPTNIVAAVVVVLLIVALFTPIADPARLSVADQTARLERGAVSPADFDFGYLRFKSGRHGLDALKRLAARTGDARAIQIALMAGDALKQKFPPYGRWGVEGAAAIVVYPRGRALPADFVASFEGQKIYCDSGYNRCSAFLIDLGGDGSTEILLMSSLDNEVFSKIAGAWTNLGFLGNNLCPAIVDDLRAGRYELAQPQSRWKDLMVGGQRLVFTPEAASPSCSPRGAVHPQLPPPSHAKALSPASAKAAPPRHGP